ncbi:MAG: class I SAM-dependent methyltransferase [Desulfobacterales bacterium]|nr:class I SAM-dependent methyltransferase [Desulfobacterales bacterium]
MNIKERIEEEMGDIPESQAIQEYLGISKILNITFALISDQISEYISLKHGPILDLGSGLGDLAFELGLRYPHFRVIGLDISEAMLKMATTSLKETSLNNIEFTLGDAHALDFKDKSMELVVSHGAMHHWKDVKTVLKEIHRVLTPNGLAYISDLYRNAPTDVVKQVADMLTENQAKAFTNSVNAAYLPQELREMLDALGINNFSISEQKFSRKTIVKNIKKLRSAAVKSDRFNELYLNLIIQK